MSSVPHTTIPLRLDNMMGAYLPPVDPDGFNVVYPAEKIEKIHAAFSTAVNLSSRKKDDLAEERIISKAWHDVHKNETLCPGYLLNVSETKGEGTVTESYRIYGALISTADTELVDEGRPNHMFGDLGIEFKHDDTGDDAWNDRANKNIEADAYTRTGVRGQLMSYGERFFFFQHRTGLFMLLVNGGEFRVVRWDRSGCIVTEVLNYVDTPEHTKKLVQFFYAFSKATPAQRGADATATRLSKDSCGWQWMQRVAVAHPQDIDHTEGTVVPSVLPGLIVTPTRDAPPSRLFATNVLAEDPAATMTGFGDLSSSSAASDAITPVFRYIRDSFRDSIAGSCLPYRLKVCGRDYLIGEPIFGPHELVGRATRGYVALEWTTQRLVFLKDVWRPFYEGVAHEGTTLAELNDAEVPFVPTLICHEDVGGPGAQETEASQYSSTGEKKHDVFGDRRIAPMPGSRSKASGSDGSTTSQARQSLGCNGTPRTQTSSRPNENRSTHATASHGQGAGVRSGKRPRTEDAPPVVLRGGLGLRHLTHYRIVVAEVCLPSTEIRSSKQLAQVIWYCMTGHKFAVVECGMLHRDVSSGNILIRPVVAPGKTGKGMVIWIGVLSDWELAKALPGDLEVAKGHQPHRAGTWYYMSVYSSNYPGHPPSIADELESFLHVMIYLAVRFLRARSLNVRDFVDSYFEDFRLSEGRMTCGYLKQNIIQTGSLELGYTPVLFVAAAPALAGRDPQTEGEVRSEVSSPLNEIIRQYLAFFKARYAILEYAVRAAMEEQAPLPPLINAIEATASTSEAEEREALRVFLLAKSKKFNLEFDPTGPADVDDSPNPAPGPATPSGTTPLALEKPSQATYDLADKLKTHDAILKMLGRAIEKGTWPKGDSEYAGDQLVGYYDVPRQLQSTQKRARLHLWSTMQSDILEGEEAP